MQTSGEASASKVCKVLGTGLTAVVTEPASVAGVRKSREAFDKAQAGTRHAGRKAKWEFTDDPKEAKKVGSLTGSLTQDLPC